MAKIDSLRKWLKEIVWKSNEKRNMNQGIEARIEAIEYALAYHLTQSQIDSLPTTAWDDEEVIDVKK